MTGRLVCPIDELYELQDCLAGRTLGVLERSEAFGWQGAELRRQFPELATVRVPDLATESFSFRTWMDDIAVEVGWTSTDVRRPRPWRSTTSSPDGSTQGEVVEAASNEP